MPPTAAVAFLLPLLWPVLGLATEFSPPAARRLSSVFPVASPPPLPLPPPRPRPRSPSPSPRPRSPSPSPPPGPSPQPSPPFPRPPTPSTRLSPPSPRLLPPSPRPSPPSLRPPPHSPNPRSPSPRPFSPSPPVVTNITGDGVRLLLDDSATSARPRGRLEVGSRNAWFSDGRLAWSPVCGGFDFNDNVARTMCALLGYRFGRTYFNPRFVLDLNDTTLPQNLVGNLICSGPAGRRQLSEADAEGGAEEMAAEATEGAHRDASLTRRSLFTALTYSVDSRSYFCTFTPAGRCPPYGQLAGVQCSNTFLPPLPPPRPPSPPRPSSPSDSIRRIGGPGVGVIWGDEPLVEANLCQHDDRLCVLSRFELKVPAPDGSGTQIWAPLCAPVPSDDMYWESMFLAATACSQALGGPGIVSGFHTVFETNFIIPSGPVSGEGNFDPAKVRGWFTVTGGSAGSMVQEFQHTVTAEPCASGAMLAVMCQMWRA